MKKKFFLFFFFCAACGKPLDKPSRSVVLVTIAPYAFFVERIVGSTVDIQTLVPSGANMHTFEPSPKDVEKAYQAKIWLRIGDSIEKKLAAVLEEKNPSLKQIKLWKEVSLLSYADTNELLPCNENHVDHAEEGKDFHFWLSAKIMQKQVAFIAAMLIDLNPQHRALYTENLGKLLEEFKKVDEQISSRLSSSKNKVILTSHPSFGYFCKDYQLTQISIECEGKEPSPKYITTLLSKAKEFKIKVVLKQPGFNNKGAEIFAEKLHLPIYSIDPYSKEYFHNLIYLTAIIEKS
ncbi:MAG: zinc ABC transporter substrate-binding protein [Chlamydiae bacterium]|nr:zinc ABC transporter substrate-binding protein [Chlamydiota bacterium]